MATYVVAQGEMTRENHVFGKADRSHRESGLFPQLAWNLLWRETGLMKVPLGLSGEVLFDIFSDMGAYSIN